MHRAQYAATILCLTACAACGGGGSTAPAKPVAGPPSLGLNAGATYAHWLGQRPEQFKMRHEVETTFFGRSEVVQGYMVAHRPRRFWVRATSPFGATLFDVKVSPPAEMEIDVRIDELNDSRAPHYLARDIRRFYLATCDADAVVEATDSGIAVRCDLEAGEPTIKTDRGPDGPDQRVTLIIDASGLLRQKRFERDGKPTAIVDYLDYKKLGERWLAHRIELKHQQIDYALTVLLLDADMAFDAARLFASP